MVIEPQNQKRKINLKVTRKEKLKKTSQIPINNNKINRKLSKS